MQNRHVLFIFLSPWSIIFPPIKKSDIYKYLQNFLNLHVYLFKNAVRRINTLWFSFAFP